MLGEDILHILTPTWDTSDEVGSSPWYISCVSVNDHI